MPIAPTAQDKAELATMLETLTCVLETSAVALAMVDAEHKAAPTPPTAALTENPTESTPIDPTTNLLFVAVTVSVSMVQLLLA
jgi:hypothetical protein